MSVIYNAEVKIDGEFYAACSGRELHRVIALVEPYMMVDSAKVIEVKIKTKVLKNENRKAVT